MSNKNAVFVLDVNSNPCNPVHPADAVKITVFRKSSSISSISLDNYSQRRINR